MYIKLLLVLLYTSIELNNDLIIIDATNDVPY